MWARGTRVGMLCAALLALAARPAAAQCAGDCNGDGTVAINELIIGVNIALGTAEAGTCAAFDADGSGDVTINELIAAVNAALNGCPAAACVPRPGGRCVEIAPGPDAQDDLLAALIEAQPNDTIYLRAGTYTLDQQLSLDVDDVTLKGEGQDKTILSFSGQTSGGEGLLVQSDGFVAEDIGFEDSPGDLLKIEGATGVTMRRVRAEWTRGPSVENGAYGLYPVQCRDVLIEDSIVRGARDAGIYVGQSRNIIVRRNNVHENVAGIEIENSTDADVYENVATNNAGGILVFNLPGPPVQDGRRTRVFNNQIVENNIENFAIPGSSVSGVPSGTGSMVLANDQVEFFGNTFRDNNSTHIVVISYNTAAFFGQTPAHNPDFDPYSEGTFIHDNTFIGGGTAPSAILAALVDLIGTPLPNILTDGDINRAHLVDGVLPDRLRLCVQQPGATFVNLDVPNNFANITTDLATVDCTHDALSGVVIGTGRHIVLHPGDGEEAVLTALLEAEPGDDILLTAGTYPITMPLSLTVDHVTIRGEGMDATVLSFTGLQGGGEGLLVQGDDFTLQDIGLEDTPKNDIVKVIGADGVTFRRVRAEWTNGADTDNGAYGLYPVQCKDVLIEDSIVRGASDAGIYVGQSRNIIVRNNVVELNVAGIEIENSTGADVHGNVATANTGGILVFNLPGLAVYGARTRVHDNQVYRNNTPNFAPAGNTVAAVPTGTGIFVLANDQVEIFNNIIRENDTNAISVISFNTAQFFGLPAPTDPRFDPFSESIYILDNSYQGGGTDPDLGDLTAVFVQLVGGLPVPQIAYDGDVDPAKLVGGALPDALRFCVQDPAGTFVNLDIPGLVGGAPMVSKDPTPFNCGLPRLAPVSIPGVK
ncbi:right-handed parallel beta-helix repeat-containing protein [bacterium]|nr:right-handed parallel beta-helix repeat-containing protein [bacterium]